jgi:hypothetical protein
MNTKRIFFTKFLALALLVVSSLQVSAQKAPGYQGHRFVLLYEFNFHPDLNGLSNFLNDQSTSSGTSGSITFLKSHTLSVDYVMNRRSAIGASIAFFSTADAHPGTPGPVNSTATPTSYNYTASALIYSLYFKFFRQHSNSIAPLGRYIKPEISILYYSGTQFISNGQSSTTVYSPTFGYFTQYKQVAATMSDFTSGPHVGMAYSFGKTFIFANRIMIDRGIRVSMVNLLHATTNANANDAKTGFPIDPAAYDFLNNQFFNFFIGIGLLP